MLIDDEEHIRVAATQALDLAGSHQKDMAETAIKPADFIGFVYASLVNPPLTAHSH